MAKTVATPTLLHNDTKGTYAHEKGTVRGLGKPVYTVNAEGAKRRTGSRFKVWSREGAEVGVVENRLRG